MTLLLLFAVISIAFSFVCSILEAALLSITPSYIAQQKLARPGLWERLRVLKDQIDQPLAAILTLNTVADFVGQVRPEQFSRYPVLDEEEIPLGMLFRHDVIGADPTLPVTSLMKPVTVVSDQENVEGLLSRFINERQHMFLIYDEYGGWMGLVTMEDVIEAIIGQSILDETDDIPNLRRHAKRRWKNRLKARLPADFARS